MATVKLTTVRGKPNLKDVAVSAGTTIAGSDAMELNIDFTKATRGDVLTMLEAIQQKIIASKWPMI
ncbi:hypothetical protein [Sphingomonas jatrophae]|uniref:Uncharacterized protein n=1 Tax=Sphingomonas jatrophae TaxID=1166337 RepID=A0A1I6K5J7_9SPHN|nr:hypothetical protein [Sphingomonas jatrophae]SFR86476.1 hypothetical protein SAMN05192580_1349 [Sphingomonas jatrophae]